MTPLIEPIRRNQLMNERLSPGDAMPAIMGKDSDGNEVDLVASLAGRFAFVQLFRGHW